MNKPDKPEKLGKAGKINWAFFGSSNFSVIVLDELESLGLVPDLIVTTPDKPRGRGLKTTAGPVKAWAEEREIAVFEPANLRSADTLGKFSAELKALGPWDIFLVASYGKIVPPEIFGLPRRETLNIHPSLLPKFRGPTPIESAILSDLGEKETGVTIMKVDKDVDHGPIIAQRNVPVPDWPPYYADLELRLAKEGARLFAEILPNWLDEKNGKTVAKDQEHFAATFTQKFAGGGLWISVADDAHKNLRKIRAFSGGRGVYFIAKHKGQDVRVIVTRARIVDGVLEIEK